MGEAEASGTPRIARHQERPAEGVPAVADFIKTCLYAQGHPEGRLTRSTDGQAYRWETLHSIPRPCPTAQLWRPTKPNHVSNGAQVTVNAVGQIFLRCLHSECRSRSGGQRWYVGTVPASLLPHQSVSAAGSGQKTSPGAACKRPADQDLEGASEHRPTPARRRTVSGHRADPDTVSMDDGRDSEAAVRGSGQPRTWPTLLSQTRGHRLMGDVLRSLSQAAWFGCWLKTKLGRLIHSVRGTSVLACTEEGSGGWGSERQ